MMQIKLKLYSDILVKGIDEKKKRKKIIALQKSFSKSIELY